MEPTTAAICSCDDIYHIHTHTYYTYILYIHTYIYTHGADNGCNVRGQDGPRCLREEGAKGEVVHCVRHVHRLPVELKKKTFHSKGTRSRGPREVVHCVRHVHRLPVELETCNTYIHR